MVVFIKKILILIFNWIDRLRYKTKLWEIYLNKDIHIKKTTYIHPSAIVEIKSGGEITIGEDGHIWEGVIIQSFGGNIKIGDNCNINPNTVIYGHGNTTIGNNVLIAGGCMIIPANHGISKTNVPICKQKEIKKPIIIHDDVWIAHGCSILSGVTIGKGSVIGAGSVVNRNVEPYSIYAGVPAQKIRDRKSDSL